MSSSPKYVNSQRSTRLGRSTLLILSCLVVLGISGFVFGLTSYYILYSYRGFRCLNSGNPLSIGVPLDKMAGHGSGTSGINDNGGKRRHKVLGFVGIQTGLGSSGRRRSLRKTWMPSDRASLQRLKESTGLAMRFVIGRTKDEALMSELEKEIALYDDFLLLDIEEHYNNLPHKTMAYFRAAFALFDAKFYVKIDDDIYLRPDRLSMLLAKERSHPYTYIGCMKKGPFYKDPKHKWHEPLSYMLGKEYFLHAYGAIYALSADVVATLVSVRNDSIRMFRNEDVTIGAWMLAMAVNHEDNRALCEEECTSSSIAVWTKHICSGVCHPETNLLELHQNETCSEGPTLNA